MPSSPELPEDAPAFRPERNSDPEKSGPAKPERSENGVRRQTNPRHPERKARNLARYQRRAARCRRGSINRRKAKARVARAHRKVRPARQDFLHRTTTNLVRRADTIVIEDLNVRGALASASGTIGQPGENATQKSGLNRGIADAGWGEFRRRLAYKAERYGRTLVVIDRWYPSSKTCAACGHLLAKLSLFTRHWTCPTRRTRHDRDIDAAKNILAAGRAVARDTPGDVCGAGVSRQGSSVPQPAVKQKPRAARRVA